MVLGLSWWKGSSWHFVRGTMNDEVPDLFADDGREVGSYYCVHVAVADYKAIAVWDREAGDRVALFGGDGGCLERAEVEEDHYFGGGDELA